MMIQVGSASRRSLLYCANVQSKNLSSERLYLLHYTTALRSKLPARESSKKKYNNNGYKKFMFDNSVLRLNYIYINGGLLVITNRMSTMHHLEDVILEEWCSAMNTSH